MKCSNCDTKISDSDSYYMEGEGDVCEHCYYEVGFECVLCSERFGDSLKSDYVLFKSELLNPPGIYLVLHYPFLLCPLIGSDSVYNSDVLFVDKLPQPDADYEISGSICDNCCKPYQRTLREAYHVGRKWLSRNSCQTSALERMRVRQVVRKNPEMLRDMELDPEDEIWIELKERFGLTDDVPTFREWLFLEYKGVKIYSVYSPGSSSRLSLDPRPKFRSQYSLGYPVFEAYSLPTWRDPIHPGYSHEHPREDKEAIITAIDKGIFEECVCPNAKD